MLSICIFFTGQDKCIRRCIKSIKEQALNFPNEKLVFGSLCPASLLKDLEVFAGSDFRFFVEPERTGKINAVNKAIENSKGDVCVLINGDTYISPNAIQHLYDSVKSGAGMTGGRKMPLDNGKKFWSSLNRIRYELEDRLSVESPRLGELIAFNKKLVSRIPPEAITDEAYIEYLCRRQNKPIVYCRDAIVYNKGPENISDFIAQRRRCHVGHIKLKSEQNYKVASINNFLLIKVLGRLEAAFALKSGLYICVLFCMEGIARALAYLDILFKTKKHVAWKLILSTKDEVC